MKNEQKKQSHWNQALALFTGGLLLIALIAYIGAATIATKSFAQEDEVMTNDQTADADVLTPEEAMEFRSEITAQSKRISTLELQVKKLGLADVQEDLRALAGAYEDAILGFGATLTNVQGIDTVVRGDAQNFRDDRWSASIDQIVSEISDFGRLQKDLHGINEGLKKVEQYLKSKDGQKRLKKLGLDRGAINKNLAPYALAIAEIEASLQAHRNKEAVVQMNETVWLPSGFHPEEFNNVVDALDDVSTTISKVRDESHRDQLHALWIEMRDATNNGSIRSTVHQLNELQDFLNGLGSVLFKKGGMYDTDQLKSILNAIRSDEENED